MFSKVLHRFAWTIATTIGLTTPVLAEAPSHIGAFSTDGLTGWEAKSFHGQTRYRLVQDTPGQVLKAESAESASGLYFKADIDLAQTPCLTWSWKTDNILHNVIETTKPGDDYPARVYVVFSTGPFFWNTRAVNYVWSNNQPVGSAWLNAFTDHAVLIATSSGAKNVGAWVSQSRNVREDYRRHFGDGDAEVEAVAVMTDTDNSGQSATAYYGDITFDNACVTR